MFFSPCSNFFFIELEQSLDPNTNSAKSLSNVFSFHIYPSLLPCQTHRPCSAELPLPSLPRLWILFLFVSFYVLIIFSSLKRKDRPDDPLSSTSPLPNSTTTPQEEEYEAGRVICQVCGTGIAFRDEATNEFTMKHWDAHRLAWYIPFISSSWSSSLIPFVKAHHPLPLDPRLETPSFTPPKVPQRLWLILLQNEGVLNAQKKSASTTSNQTLMSQSLKPIASFVPLATSGSVSGQIPLTAQYHGMLIVRVAWQKKCGLYTLAS